VSITVSKTQLKQVLDKLDSVKFELLRLRATLLPQEELSKEERKKLEEARKQIKKGLAINLEDLIKELG
jgi:transcriptional/translational regulatory protein YebC/TACO1